VVAADEATFAARHPGVTNVVAGWGGTLSHTGEEIRVEDAEGRVVASLIYASEGDWAVRRIGSPDRLDRQGWEWFAAHDGLGASLELVNPSLPNEFGQNWAASDRRRHARRSQFGEPDEYSTVDPRPDTPPRSAALDGSCHSDGADSGRAPRWE
jgi:hypothetical protein